MLTNKHEYCFHARTNKIVSSAVRFGLEVSIFFLARKVMFWREVQRHFPPGRGRLGAARAACYVSTPQYTACSMLFERDCFYSRLKKLYTS
jgi:hypothetical protein